MEIKPKILIKTEYLPDKIDIKHIPSSRKINPKIEKLSEENWSKIIRAAKKQGKMA